jgi:glycosyltransferase involved in cell wall biosynthesis
MFPKLKNHKKTVQQVCVVSRELVSSDLQKEDTHSLLAFAQRLALAGGSVTVLWLPKEDMKSEDVAKLASQFQDTFSIKVDVYDYEDETTNRSVSPIHVSLGIYTYIKRNDYSTIYLPLEGGLPYYSLLAKETGVYKGASRISVLASAPLEWSLEADRLFFWSAEQLKIAFMEKYCAEQADRLICTSSSLKDWMESKKWKLAQNCEVLPALSPIEWTQTPDVEDAAPVGEAREIVLIASPRFRDGITLFCDVLDRLTELTSDNLTVTIIGGFYRILGEHTGGMFIRRGRRWKFRLRYLRQLTLREGITYAKEIGAVAIIPHYENSGGYAVSECIRIGVPFVATDVGGNVEQVDFFGIPDSLVIPHAKDLAAALLMKLKTPDRPRTKKTEEQKFQSWIAVLLKTAKREMESKQKTNAVTRPPLVSVIMTHHDRPQYFLQAVASVREQSYLNIEVIIVDDGSVLPESHAMLDSLEAEFKSRKWKIIRTANRYVGAARNTGVRASRGKFIVFLDDDNALFPEAIETFVAAITKSNSDVCTALSRNFYGHHTPGSGRFNYVGWIPLGASPDVSFFESCFGDTISIYRKTVFGKIGYQFEKFGYMVEDYEFFVRITLGGLKLRLIPEPLFWYRVSTQGRYRSSHFYDNQLPILDAFKRSKFKHVENLYKLVLGQNIANFTKESYKANLRYSPSDREFFELSEMQPNSREAIALMARLAANEGRPDTAVGLLASLGVKEFESELDGILKGSLRAQNALASRSSIFASTTVLSANDLLAIRVSSDRPQDIQPQCYVEPPGKLFFDCVGGSISAAVLSAGIPASTISVSSQVSMVDAVDGELECLLLVCQMFEDPIVAVQSVSDQQRHGNSGWIAIGSDRISSELAIYFSNPTLATSNLVLALRSRTRAGKSLTGCFESISIRVGLEDQVGRPRLGKSPPGQRGRTWTNDERTSAHLETPYSSQLPLLMFPRDLEDGIFLRPSTQGPVVASIDRGFPAFANRMKAQVEIAHSEASPFEFAVALSLPGTDVRWRASGPKNAVGFSGWIKVEEQFTIRDLEVKLLELIGTPLTISLAIRLSRGSRPSPSNAFWRSLQFFWEV